jgi:hypothetical protein
MTALIWLLASCAPTTTAPAEATPRVVTGGTLSAGADGALLASDPEGDRLWVLAVRPSLAVSREIPLPAGSFPGRLVADGADRAWVALRGRGELARVDLRSGALDLFPVCADPRGLWRDPDGALWVTCVDGALVHLDADGRIRRRDQLPDDLRDVIRVGTDLWISRFRSSEILIVREGEVTAVLRPPTRDGAHPAAAFPAAVAWRMVPDPATGGALLAHQRVDPNPIDLDAADAFGAPAYGGGGCDAVAQTGLTRFTPDGAATTLGPIQKQVLPVDVAPRLDGRVTLVAAGAGGLSDVAAAMVHPAAWGADGACTMLPGLSWSAVTGDAATGGRVTSALDTPSGLVLQTQSPLSFVVAREGGVTERLSLGDAPDRGVELLHHAPTGSVACASCHPEGLEDGQTWTFLAGGASASRRTQSLAGGGLDATAPLHWDGSLPDLEALLTDTFVRRIGGDLRPGDADALRALLDRVEPPRASADPALAAAGEVVWRDAGCAACHAGAWATDNLAHDVGTGAGPLQTPSLRGVGLRGPWMSDGCAATLEQRFDAACGGDAHGEVAPEAVPALVAWLRAR